MIPPSKRPAYANRYAKLYRSGYRIMVDATPTIRRAQALAAIGYPRRVLAEVLDMNDPRHVTKFFSGRTKKVYPHIAEAMSEFYEAHCMKPVTTPGGRRASISARKMGYTPPLGWDDIDLDPHPHVRRRAA